MPNGRFLARVTVALAFVAFCVGAYAQYAEQNVNMVAGKVWPNGDPFLRQQNEPSVAVSTRNPLHILAGANDYRTVDIPFSTPPRPDEEETGDAWLSYFVSKDGGNQWTSTLLDGYPQQNNLSSPLNGFQAAADPVVRAANNGLFYYTGIVMNRGTNPLSGVFVARFIDRNNTESGIPIVFLDTKLLGNGTAGQFIDKPWIAVAPMANGAQCTVDGQTFPARNVFLAYSILVGNDVNIRTKIMFTRSTDCGNTWSSPIKLSETYSVNQGVNIAVDPANGNNVYVAWRRFADTNDANSIIIAKSTNAGGTFGKGVVAANITPFDEGTTTTRIRTNAYPTIAIDNNGRVYLAWSQRDSGTQDGRIVLTYSADGQTAWSAPAQIAPIAADGTSAGRGHQFMPAMTFSSGKLTLVWYDLRDDGTIGGYELKADGSYTTKRLFPLGTNLPGHPDIVFWTFLADASPYADPSLKLTRRHTLDVYAMESNDLSSVLNGGPTFTNAARITRYKYGTLPPLYKTIQDVEIDPPNLPMFHGGTVPFFGDYIDIAAYVNAGATTAGTAKVRHVVWTDNRDVRVPLGSTPPDWTKYTPVQSGSLGSTSLFDPTQTPPPCTTDEDSGQAMAAGSRNQNVYTTRVTDGLFAGSPANTKPLGTIQRAFTVFIQNTTNVTTDYQLSFSLPLPAGTTASFAQFNPAVGTLPVSVLPHSTATRMVFVTGPAGARVDVIVATTGGLTTVVSLNPDPTTPPNGSIATEIFNPEVANPEVANPEVANPEVANPEVANPEVANPEVANPEVANPEVANPEVANPEVANPEVANPEVANPEVANTDIGNASMTDTSWNTTNNGNSTGGYTVKLYKLQDLPAGVSTRLILAKFYDTPIARGCVLGDDHHWQVSASIKDPLVVTDPNALTDPSLNLSDAKNATMWLGPGETGQITVRLMTAQPGQTLAATDFFVPVAISQAVNTADAGPNGTHTPPVSLTITTTSLPTGAVGQPYTATLTSVGGVGTPSWSISTKTPLPAGLTLAGATIGGTPALAGTFLVTIIATDSATPIPDTASKTFTLQIGPVRTFFVTNTNDFGPGSLRQAILDSNANVERTDKVVFAIPGAAPHIIKLFSPLPTITDPAVIDATALGACDGTAPAVQIDGTSAASANGLSVTSGGTTIRGLAITNFVGQGILLSGGGGNVVQCSYVGLAPDGVTANANTGNGIQVVDSPSNTIGGTGVARNVISGNNGEGIRIDGLYSIANVVQGNYIGTSASGTNARGNHASGVYVRRAPSNHVSGNVISGNLGFAGVAICGNQSFCGGGEIGTTGSTADSNRVFANFIGTDPTATAALGNGGFGVSLDSAPNNVIGGPNSGDGNVIAANIGNGIEIFGVTPDANLIRGNFIGTDVNAALNLGNGGAGVFLATGSNNVVSGTISDIASTAQNVIMFNGGAGISLAGTAGNGNLLQFNRIDSNAGLGIDLGADAVTPNDAVDADSGPNTLQNFPVLTSATSSGGTTIIQGSIQTTPNTQFTIDYYYSAACDPTGNGEGNTWLTGFTATTNTDGFLSFATNTTTPVPLNSVITATATTAGGTSEFSACIPVVFNLAGGALSFNGTNNIVTIPTAATLNLQSLTIEGWIKIDDPNFAQAPLVSKGSDYGNYTLLVGGDLGSGTVPHNVGYVHQIAGGGNFSCCSVTPGPVQYGAWTHVAATFANGSSRVYLNGQLIAGTGSTWPPPLTNNAALTLGRAAFASVPSQYLNGLLDEVRIWSVARTDSEIALNYNRAIDPATPGLVAYWKFDEPNGQTVVDSSPNGNNGVLGADASVATDDPTRVTSTAPIQP